MKYQVMMLTLAALAACTQTSGTTPNVPPPAPDAAGDQAGPGTPELGPLPDLGMALDLYFGPDLGVARDLGVAPDLAPAPDLTGLRVVSIYLGYSISYCEIGLDSWSEARVISTPPGLDCGKGSPTNAVLCSAGFSPGATVTLQATISPYFSPRWTGCSTSTSTTCTILPGTTNAQARLDLYAASELRINLIERTSQLRLSPAGAFSSNLEGPNRDTCAFIGTSCCIDYVPGTVVTFTDILGGNNAWGGACAGTPPLSKCVLTMPTGGASVTK